MGVDWSNPLAEGSAGLGDELHVGGREWGMMAGKGQDDTQAIFFPFTLPLSYLLSSQEK